MCFCQFDNIMNSVKCPWTLKLRLLTINKLVFDQYKNNFRYVYRCYVVYVYKIIACKNDVLPLKELNSILATLINLKKKIVVECFAAMLINTVIIIILISSQVTI